MKCPGCNEEITSFIYSENKYLRTCPECGWKAHIKVWEKLKKEEKEILKNQVKYVQTS